MSSVVNQRWWDDGYASYELAYEPASIPFQDLFQRYVRPGGSCLEIGCFPGRFLIYLGTTFDMEVSGIDLTPKVTSHLLPMLRQYPLRIGEIVEGDFMQYRPEHAFDFVCSFGFIEHFPDFELVLEHHIAMVKPGGTLIVTTPNFRGVQQILRQILDTPNMSRHVLPAMDPWRWAHVCTRVGMDILHVGHHGTFGFWQQDKSARWKAEIARRLGSMGRWLNQRLDAPNALTSPYAVIVARRPEVNR